MHNVYAGTRKVMGLSLLVLVLIWIRMMPSDIAFASVFPEADLRAGMEVSTASNASANMETVEIATASDAENLSETAGESSSEENVEPDEEWLFDDREITATASNAAVQAESYPPQISVVVPTRMVILVAPDGTCRAAGGSLENHGEHAVLLTGVTFTWQTEGSLDADDIFTEWDRRKPYAVLMPGEGASQIFGQENEMSSTWNAAAEQIIVEPDEELELSWQFELNGNALGEALDAEEEAAVATVIYTVRDLET